MDNRAAAVQSVASGWRGVEWNGMFLAYEGPYRTLRLVEDANFEMSMQDALNAAGYKVALYVRSQSGLATSHRRPFAIRHLHDENNFAVIGDAGRFVQLTESSP